MKTALKLLCLLACLAAAGCVVPWPHTRIHAPAREGVVVAGNAQIPVAGAVVTSLENGKQCVTDDTGRFALPAVKGWHWGKMVSPVLVYSMWPFLDLANRNHRIRIEADGFAAYDEELGGTVREVRIRSFGSRHPSGRLWCPVETQRVEIARCRPVAHGSFVEEQWTAAGCPDRGWPLPNVPQTIRLFRPDEAQVPVSLCFDLADETQDDLGKAPPPDSRPPKARVLWFGRDAPMAVLFGECPPAESVLWTPSWEEIDPIWLGNPASGRIAITLDADGRPARFEMHLPWPNPATRRDAIATGAISFRIVSWETFGLPDVSPALWPSLRTLDPRLEIR